MDIPEFVPPAPEISGRDFRVVQLVTTEGITLARNRRGWFLKDRQTGPVVSVNDAAACVWHLSAQGLDLGQVETALREQFPQVPDIAVDIETAVKAFEARGLARRQEIGFTVRTVSYALDYPPEEGRRSAKADRLVRYCLGDYADQPPPACSADLDYTAIIGLNSPSLLCEVRDGAVTLRRIEPAAAEAPFPDQKRIVEAWISQRTRIPSTLRCWVLRADGAGASTDAGQGPHLSAVRKIEHPHVILVPGSDRNRFLGPKLASQMRELAKIWTPWNDKSDTAWWGGATTGGEDDRDNVLSRYRVLRYYGAHPCDRFVIHPSNYSDWQDAGMPPARGDFEKADVYRHKCLVLLKGNDAPSGLSWYFCGNSVVLMQPPVVEHMLYFDMQPWVHYVPLEPDPADVLTKLDWVLANQEEAQAIVRRAHEHLEWFTGPEYLWACNEVLRRVAGGRHTPD